MNEDRPALLELGLLLSAAHALLWLGLTLLGTVLVALGVGVAASLSPVAFFPAALVGGLTGAILGITIGWCLLTLYACYATYNGSRAWTWALLALSIVGLMDFGLLSTPARIVTIIGIFQLLDRRQTQAA